LIQDQGRKYIAKFYDICPQGRTGNEAVRDEAELSQVDRSLCWKGQFFNPYSLIIE